MKRIFILFFLSINIIYGNGIDNKINLNKATIGELNHAIKGIGKARAKAIIEYRNTHGPFITIEELSKVKGFSRKFVKKKLNELMETFTIENN